MKFTRMEGVLYKMGQNAAENWELLDKAAGDDIFFHLTKFPSCYVIMEVDDRDKDISLDMCIAGAEICKAGTKYKNLNDVRVDYCKCSNLTKGSQCGQVIYKSRRKVSTLKV